MSAIALGSAQFGLDYGITNSKGLVAEREVLSILNTAQDLAINWIDTAAAYGNAEERLGALLAGDPHFRICSKTMPRTKGQTSLSAAQRSLDATLTRLRRDHVDALLIHSAKDLLESSDGTIWAWMCSARAQGMARSIGVSVYDADELDAVLAHCQPDWIQLPCSVLDQRLIDSGHMAKLSAKGIKIQARSVLLQGLVSVAPADLPAPMQALLDPLTRLSDAATQHGLVQVDMAIAWASSQAAIDLAVLGVTSAGELRQCADAFQRRLNIDWHGFACSDVSVLDPRQWPKGMRIVQ